MTTETEQNGPPEDAGLVVTGAGEVVGTVPALARRELTVAALIGRRDKIKAAMEQAMIEHVHYGIVPGVSKPTLLKPGAEVLAVLFGLAPTYPDERLRMRWEDRLLADPGADADLTVTATCVLLEIGTGFLVAEGVGLCSTRETKYAFRQGQRTCPVCGEPQVRLSKPRDDGRGREWYCWRKEGGCGETWPEDSEEGRAFASVDVGKVPNPALADTYNTVVKMAAKRALIAAALNATGASELFTQDVEDQPHAREPQRPKLSGWADVRRLIETFDPDGWALFEAMAQDESEERWGTRDGASLTDEEKGELFQAAAQAAANLAAAYTGGRPTEADYLAAWGRDPDEGDAPVGAGAASGSDDVPF